jgi:hypothetical protein
MFFNVYKKQWHTCEMSFSASSLSRGCVSVRATGDIDLFRLSVRCTSWKNLYHKSQSQLDEYLEKLLEGLQAAHERRLGSTGFCPRLV